MLMSEWLVRFGLDDGKHIAGDHALNDQTAIFNSYDPVLLIED